MQFRPNSRCTPEELVHGEEQVIPFVFCISRWGFGVVEVSDRKTLGSNINQLSSLCGFFNN